MMKHGSLHGRTLSINALMMVNIVYIINNNYLINNIIIN